MIKERFGLTRDMKCMTPFLLALANLAKPTTSLIYFWEEVVILTLNNLNEDNDKKASNCYQMEPKPSAPRRHLRREPPLCLASLKY